MANEINTTTLDQQYGIHTYTFPSGDPNTLLPNAVIGSEATDRSTGNKWMKQTSGWVLVGSGSSGISQSYADAHYLALAGGTLTGRTNAYASVASAPVVDTYNQSTAGGSNAIHARVAADSNFVFAGYNAAGSNTSSIKGDGSGTFTYLYANNWLIVGASGFANQAGDICAARSSSAGTYYFGSNSNAYLSFASGAYSFGSAGASVSATNFIGQWNGYTGNLSAAVSSTAPASVVGVSGTTVQQYNSTAIGAMIGLSNYLTTSSASSTYLTQSSASSTYLTQSSASSTYLTQSNASATYFPKSGGTVTGATLFSAGVSGNPVVDIYNSTTTAGSTALRLRVASSSNMAMEVRDSANSATVNASIKSDGSGTFRWIYTGGWVVAGAAYVANDGDIGAARSSTVGYYYFGNNSSAYLSYNSGMYSFGSAGNLTVNGNVFVTSYLAAGAYAGGARNAGDIVARRSSTTGCYYFGDATTTYLYLNTSGNYQFGPGPSSQAGLSIPWWFGFSIGLSSPYGYIAAAQGANSLINGSQTGDLCIRAESKQIVFSVNGGTNYCGYFSTIGTFVCASDITGSDLHAFRNSNTATGVIYLGNNNGESYLFYDSTNYVFGQSSSGKTNLVKANDFQLL